VSAVAEGLIAAACRRAVGPAPVVLCGSRAIGTAGAASDFDVLVVLPARRLPGAVRRLGALSRSLEAELGAPVSVNPLPAFRLRSRGNLFAWKIRAEGRVLAPPAGFALRDGCPPPHDAGQARSYLLSALLFLIGEADPAQLAADPLPAGAARAARKALLHLAQLRLIRRGTYAARLDEALAAAGDERLAALAVSLQRPATWLAVRDEVLAELAWCPARPQPRRGDLQYVALSALRGRARWAAARAGGVERRLARAATLLAAAVEPGGGADEARVAAAWRALPRALRPASPGWAAVRDAVVAEWPSAHPLLGYRA
jgi:predicted nucleotidyltransferase